MRLSTAIGIRHSVSIHKVSYLVIGIAITIDAAYRGQPVEEIVPECFRLGSQDISSFYQISIGVPGMSHIHKGIPPDLRQRLYLPEPAIVPAGGIISSAGAK